MIPKETGRHLWPAFIDHSLCGVMKAQGVEKNHQDQTLRIVKRCLRASHRVVGNWELDLQGLMSEWHPDQAQVRSASHALVPRASPMESLALAAGRVGRGPHCTERGLLVMCDGTKVCSSCCEGAKAQ